MPKRRAPSDEEDEVSGNAQQSAPEEEVVKKSKKSTTKSEKPKASPNTSTSMTPIDQLRNQPQDQSSKKQKKGKEAATADGEVKTSGEGDKYVDLGRNRRATVRVFKGMSFRLADAIWQSRNDVNHRPGTPLIDIREYFGSGEEQKPGKKGISLKVEEVKKCSIVHVVTVLMRGSQWQALKQNADAIDGILSGLQTKD